MQATGLGTLSAGDRLIAAWHDVPMECNGYKRIRKQTQLCRHIRTRLKAGHTADVKVRGEQGTPFLDSFPPPLHSVTGAMMPHSTLNYEIRRNRGQFRSNAVIAANEISDATTPSHLDTHGAANDRLVGERQAISTRRVICPLLSQTVLLLAMSGSSGAG
jgi:hypothetical protein